MFPIDKLFARIRSDLQSFFIIDFSTSGAAKSANLNCISGDSPEYRNKLIIRLLWFFFSLILTIFITFLLVCLAYNSIVWPSYDAVGVVVEHEPPKIY